MTWMGMDVPVESMPGLANADEAARLKAARGADADRLYAQLMTAHHEAGIHMAEYAAANAGTTRVRRFASSMVKSQRSDLDELQRVGQQLG